MFNGLNEEVKRFSIMAALALALIMSYVFISEVATAHKSARIVPIEAETALPLRDQ